MILAAGIVRNKVWMVYGLHLLVWYRICDFNVKYHKLFEYWWNMVSQLFKTFDKTLKLHSIRITTTNESEISSNCKWKT